MKTPLAWLQVTREHVRLLVAVAGIAFANILIFMQLGFLQSLFDGSTRPHHCLCADLIMVNPKQETFFSVRSFPRQRLYQALGYPGVESVASVLVGTVQWKNPEKKNSRSILVFGINPSKAAFELTGVKQNLHRLRELNRVLFDRDSRPEYGPIAKLLEVAGTVEAELNSKVVRVVGLYCIGASFAADGSVITSDTTFHNLFGYRNPDDIEIGLIKTKPWVDLTKLQQAMRTDFKDEVSIYTKEEFAEVERSYWANSSGIGFIFGMGVVVGFIVGVVIVYQILYADVSDHLHEYATLKAIGYTDGYLLKVLMQESLILAVFGFIPGFSISAVLYEVARTATLLPISMTWERALLVFVLTLAMCSISAAIATDKLRKADPADVF